MKNAKSEPMPSQTVPTRTQCGRSGKDRREPNSVKAPTLLHTLAEQNITQGTKYHHHRDEQVRLKTQPADGIMRSETRWPRRRDSTCGTLTTRFLRDALARDLLAVSPAAS